MSKRIKLEPPTQMDDETFGGETVVEYGVECCMCGAENQIDVSEADPDEQCAEGDRRLYAAGWRVFSIPMYEVRGAVCPTCQKNEDFKAGREIG